MLWIVFANRIRAKVFTIENEKFQLIDIYENPLGRLKSKYMRNDQLGKIYIGTSSHVLNKGDGPHENAADQFARKISKTLKKKLKKIKSLKLTIAAEPHFLGKIKKHFSEDFIKSRVKWIEKDLEKIPQNKWFKIISKDNPETFKMKEGLVQIGGNYVT